MNGTEILILYVLNITYFIFSITILYSSVNNTILCINPVEGREEVRRRTFAELHDDVAVYAAALKKMGVQKGDRVVG